MGKSKGLSCATEEFRVSDNPRPPKETQLLLDRLREENRRLLQENLAFREQLYGPKYTPEIDPEDLNKMESTDASDSENPTKTRNEAVELQAQEEATADPSHVPQDDEHRAVAS